MRMANTKSVSRICQHHFDIQRVGRRGMPVMSFPRISWYSETSQSISHHSRTVVSSFLSIQIDNCDDFR